MAYIFRDSNVLAGMEPGIVDYKQFKLSWFSHRKTIKEPFKYITAYMGSLPIKRITGYG